MTVVPLLRVRGGGLRGRGPPRRGFPPPDLARAAPGTARFPEYAAARLTDARRAGTLCWEAMRRYNAAAMHGGERAEVR